MSNPNFVSDLVAMAKAFEELPAVKEQLDQAHTMIENYAKQVQRLEMRLIDISNELDTANANTRKVEVERDHAERMFLEADERLTAFRGLLSVFQSNASALVAAAEPEPKPEPEVKAIDNPLYGDSQHEPTQVTEALTVGAEAEGQRDADPTTSTDQSHTGSMDGTAPTAEPSSLQNSDAAPEVAAQPDPTPATESSSENVSQGSTQPETDARAESAVDPTSATTHAEETQSSATDTVMPTADATGEVGYHNEPKIGAGGGAEAWADWDVWCKQMNAQHPQGWPPRPIAQAAQ